MDTSTAAPELDGAEIEALAENAARASEYLKAISHEHRLMILCHLSSGEKSVSELENLLRARQAAVSQQLSRLRQRGMVRTRRDGRTIYYSLADDRAAQVIGLVHELFCNDG